jgi:hypothetical protein
MLTKKETAPRDAETGEIKNKVHELLSEIEGYFNKEKKTTATPEDINLLCALECVGNIANGVQLTTVEKLDALNRLANAIKHSSDHLSDSPKITPLAYWADRPQWERHMSPCDFVIRNYPTYGKGLTQADVRNTDRPLYAALHGLKTYHGWPSDFDLPSRAERNAELLRRNGKIPTLSEIAKLAPPDIRELIRLYEMGRSRVRKKPNDGAR